MLPKTTGLLLAGLSFVHAGIFQRQCLPSTVTVTAVPAPTYGAAPVNSAPGETTTITLAAAPRTSADSTTTVTITQTETETTTITALPETTFTSILTNSITVHPSTTTVFQTARILASGSPAAPAYGAEGITQQAPEYQNQGLPVTTAVPASTTVQLVQTYTVVPVPADATYGAQDPSSNEPTSTSTTTVVIHATSTDFITNAVTISSAFPTLTVTGTMGITPSVFSGSATAGPAGAETGTGGARAGTGLAGSAPTFSSSALTAVSMPPFANTTIPGAIASSAPAASLGTAGSTAPLSRRCHIPAKRGVELNRRQVGAIVTATIDGVVVTWTNTWNGVVTPTTASAAVQTLQTPAQSTAVVVTATIDGSVVSWTQSVVAAEATFAPAPMTTATALESPVSALTWSSSYMPASLITSTAEASSSTSSATTSAAVTLPSTLISSAAAEPSSSTPLGPPPGYAPPAWLTSEFPFPPAETSSLSALSTSMPLVANSSVATSTASSTGSPSSPGTVSTTPTTSGSGTSLAAPTCTSSYSGNFTIDFDDLPRNGEPPSSEQYPPFQNPYHDLYWSQGFSYAPPPNDPYVPHGSQLGVFITDGNANIHSQNWTGPLPNDTDVNGMFGAGPNLDPAFYIDVFSAYVGCENSGTEECQIQVLGYTLQEPEGNLGLQAEQYFYQRPCSSNCSLQLIELGDAFRNLTAVQIQATHQGDSTNTALTWYIDDISLAWTDNSCEAINARNKAGGFRQNQRRDQSPRHGRMPVPPSKRRELDI